MTVAGCTKPHHISYISPYLAISRISAISGTFTQPHPRDDAADSDAKSQKTRVIPGFPQQKLGYTRVLPEIMFGQFFEVLTTRNISLYLAVSYYISLYLTVSLISHHIRDGFCEQSRPGPGEGSRRGTRLSCERSCETAFLVHHQRHVQPCPDTSLDDRNSSALL